MRLINIDKLVSDYKSNNKNLSNVTWFELSNYEVKAIPILTLLKNIADKLNEIEQLTPTWLSQLELGMLEKCDIDFAEGYKRALSDIIDIIKRYDHEKDI